MQADIPARQVYPSGAPNLSHSFHSGCDSLSNYPPISSSLYSLCSHLETLVVNAYSINLCISISGSVPWKRSIYRYVLDKLSVLSSKVFFILHHLLMMIVMMTMVNIY